MTTKRVVVFTSQDRASLLERILTGYEVVLLTDTDPDYFAQLANYDRKGFDIAVIDDAGVRDAARMEGHVERFQREPRPSENHLRIIFSAAPDRPADDIVYSRFISVGIHDLILPLTRGNNIEKYLPALIEKPLRYADVANLARPVAQSIFNSDLAPRSKDDKSGESLRLLTMEGKRTIACLGILKRSGTSHIAQIIARSLYLAGYTVCLVIQDKKTFDAIKCLYPACVSKDGAYSLGGVDIWHGSKVADTNQQTQFTVLDLGVADFDPAATTMIAKDPLWQHVKDMSERWLSSDCKVLVGCSGFQDIVRWEHIIRGQTPYQVNKWNLAVNLGSASMVKEFARGIKAFSPHANLFSVEQWSDPLGQKAIPEFLSSIFLHNFGQELASVFHKPATPKNQEESSVGRQGFLGRLLSGRAAV